MENENLEKFLSRFRYLNFAAQLISGDFYESGLKEKIIADIENLINQYDTWNPGIFENIYNEIEKNFHENREDREIYLTQILRKLDQFAPYLNITADREFCYKQRRTIFKIGNQEFSQEHNIVFETLLKYHAWERQNFDDSTFPIPVKYVILCFQYYRLFFKQLDIICQDYSIEITQIQKDKGFFIWERENVALAVVAYHTVFISPPEIVEEESIGTNSPTKKIIFDEIETIDSSQGWRYAFSKEDDFLQFVELLTCYFEYRPYTIPQEIIKLKKNCKTRFAKVLQPIHKKLSEKALNSEVEFFELLRVLNHFNKSTDTEIYKCIIR